MSLHQRIKKASDVILNEKYVRIISHYDADGIAAAGIMCSALFRKKIGFHVSLVKSLGSKTIDRIKNEKNALVLFLDMGSGQIDDIEDIKSTVIILDHHAQFRESKIIQVNPHFFGINGTDEACASTLSFLLAKSVDEKNSDLVGLCVAGVVGDKQIPFKSLNKEIIEEGIKNGFIKKEKGLSLGLEPFFREGFNPTGDKRFDDSMIIMKLLKQNVKYDVIEKFFGIYHISEYETDALTFSDVLNACGRTDNEGLGLEICLNKKMFKEGMKIKEQYEKEIKKYALKLDDEVKKMKHIQYFYSEKPNLSGVLAGVGMAYLFDQEKPTLALSKVNNLFKVSSRGTGYLVDKGLDLADALKASAESLGGHGGGHNIAAGATVSADKDEEFLNMVDNIVGEQMK
ncbi:MAG: DHH family phosphoesterase [Candidatus Thermoplasmatota archaeon]|nr:DHH family phosphoesterase [Candidatus Thermoplasmatota archaeon]